MLPSKYRFHSRGGVNYTRSHGKNVRGQKVSLVLADNTHGKKRFGVIVSKKVLKSAVGRNRIRRRVYEVLRAELPSIDKPVDCLVMIFSSDIKETPYDDLRGTIHDLLVRAEIVV